MTDIVERLRLAAREGSQSGDALHQDAAREIEALRKENRQLKAKIEINNRFAEPEC